MALGRCEFVDSRLRRYPPDRSSAVSCGQAGENALRFPRLAHRSAAVHKLHSTAATSRIDFDSGKGETFSRLRALAYSCRNLSKRADPSHPSSRSRLHTCAVECAGCPSSPGFADLARFLPRSGVQRF
jgi:hypothetical protein